MKDFFYILLDMVTKDKNNSLSKNKKLLIWDILSMADDKYLDKPFISTHISEMNLKLYFSTRKKLNYNITDYIFLTEEPCISESLLVDIFCKQKYSRINTEELFNKYCGLLSETSWCLILLSSNLSFLKKIDFLDKHKSCFSKNIYIKYSLKNKDFLDKFFDDICKGIIDISSLPDNISTELLVLLDEDKIGYLLDSKKVSTKLFSSTLDYRYDYSINFIRKYLVDMYSELPYYLTTFIPFDFESILKIKDFDWNNFLNIKNLTNEEIEKFKSRLNWEKISLTIDINGDIFKNHKDKLHKGTIANNYELTEKDIKNNLDFFDDYIPYIINFNSKKKISEKFISENSDKILWYADDFYRVNKLSSKFILKYSDKINFYYLLKLHSKTKFRDIDLVELFTKIDDFDKYIFNNKYFYTNINVNTRIDRLETLGYNFFKLFSNKFIKYLNNEDDIKY